MSDPKKTITELQRLLEPEGKGDLKTAPPPELDEVLYVEPAPGGERRNCSNCVLWAPLMEQCSIHGSGVEATADHVCGYHVFGSPTKEWKDLKGLQPVSPKFSGLILAKGGTACENCQHFTPMEEEDGICAAVYKKKRPAHVHPKGCCARWTRKGPVTDPKAPQ